MVMVLMGISWLDVFGVDVYESSNGSRDDVMT